MDSTEDIFSSPPLAPQPPLETVLSVSPLKLPAVVVPKPIVKLTAPFQPMPKPEGPVRPPVVFKGFQDIPVSSSDELSQVPVTQTTYQKPKKTKGKRVRRVDSPSPERGCLDSSEFLRAAYNQICQAKAHEKDKKTKDQIDIVLHSLKAILSGSEPSVLAPTPVEIQDTLMQQPSQPDTRLQTLETKVEKIQDSLEKILSVVQKDPSQQPETQVPSQARQPPSQSSFAAIAKKASTLPAPTTSGPPKETVPRTRTAVLPPQNTFKLRRLILLTKNKSQTFNARDVRDEINQALGKTMVAAITTSQSSQNIILTTTEKFTATQLLQEKDK